MQESKTSSTTNGWLHIEKAVDHVMAMTKSIHERVCLADAQTKIVGRIHPAHAIFKFGTVALIYPSDSEWECKTERLVGWTPIITKLNVETWGKQKSAHKLVRQGYQSLIGDGFLLSPAEAIVRETSGAHIVQFQDKSMNLYNLCFGEKNVEAAAASAIFLRRADFLCPDVFAVITPAPECKLIRLTQQI